MAGPSLAVRVAIGTLTLATAVALTGCSPTPTPTHSSPPSKSAAPHSSAPKPKPTPTFAAQAYTCNSILPPATLSVFKSKQSAGFTLQSDYLQRMQNIGSNLVDFSNYGGILCQWSYPDSSSNVDYAYSAITAGQVATQQQALTANGYAGTSKYHGTLYANSDPATFPDEYLFVDGYWLQASSDSVMQLLVDNVFVTPGN